MHSWGEAKENPGEVIAGVVNALIGVESDLAVNQIPKLLSRLGSLV